MNCQLCQQESYAYHEGRLSADMRIQVESHLEECKMCAESYRLHSLAENIINREKEILPDPYLTTRIMAGIESADRSINTVFPSYIRVLRPAVIAASLAAAIFFGVIIGDIYKPSVKREPVPVELTLINDATIEAVDVLSNQ